ncbi:TetR/AcrR family transcriptional regulator [Nocardioides sp. CPCC 206347]|uniref:TetR/AcrR family transcriptional regulator n=1 Tax=unclassified Nocardioides TaxID=2615069 RepID=UPI003613FBFE
MTGDADSRRRRIIDATLDVIQDRGLVGVRTQEIARRAEVSSGLLLYHFGTLDGLIAASMQESEDRYYRGLEDEDAVGRPAPERLRLLVERSGDPTSVVAAWTLWMEFWVRALRDPDTAALCASLEARWRAVLLDVIEQGIGEGVFNSPSPKVAVVRLSALLDGLSVAATLGDREVPVEAVADLWLDAAARELDCDPVLLARLA